MRLRIILIGFLFGMLLHAAWVFLGSKIGLRPKYTPGGLRIVEATGVIICTPTRSSVLPRQDQQSPCPKKNRCPRAETDQSASRGPG